MNTKLLDIIKRSLDRELKDYKIRRGMAYDFIIIKYPNEKYGILGYENSGELYYNYEFWNEFFKKFNMKSIEYKEILLWYVGITYNWKVTIVEYSGAYELQRWRRM